MHPNERVTIFAHPLLGVVHDTTTLDHAPVPDRAAADELVRALSHPNGWRRDTAQRLLVERAPRTAVPSLARLAGAAADFRTRLHALWTLDGIDAIEPALVTAALKDPSDDVRASAVRIAERWMGEPNHPIQSAVLALIDDPSWTVRRQLAASIGALPSGSRESAAVALLERYGTDAVVMDATLSGLRGSESAVLDRLLTKASAGAAGVRRGLRTAGRIE